MRVTKRIEEYVTTKIYEALPTDREILYPEYDELMNKMMKAKNFINQIIKESTDSLVESEFAKLGLPNDIRMKPRHYDMVEFIYWDSEMEKEYMRRLRAVQERRKKAIKDILLELELGATKNDLNVLIAKAISGEE